MTNEAGTDKSSIDPTVLALGKLSKAMETVERARGHLYSFHQLTGEADFQVGTAVVALREAGRGEVAARLERELIGLNVLSGRWTFQVVDEYDEGYYRIVREEVSRAHSELGVERHAYEAELKALNVTPGKPGHELTPDPAVRPHDEVNAVPDPGPPDGSDGPDVPDRRKVPEIDRPDGPRPGRGPGMLPEGMPRTSPDSPNQGPGDPDPGAEHGGAQG